jgi:signal transduction histidine kinase
MSERTAGRLAWTIGALTLAAVIADQVLFFVTPQAELAPRLRQTGADVLDELANLGLTVIGGLIAVRRPRNPLGWLLLSAGVGLAISNLGFAYAVYATEVADTSLWAVGLLDWLSAWTWTLAIAALPLLLLLFPTGSLHSRRWRPFLWITVASSSLLVLTAMALATISAFVSEVPLSDENLEFDDPFLQVLGGVVFGCFFLVMACSLVALVSTVLRYRAATGEERLQLRWFVLAASLFVGAIILEQFAPDVVGSLLFATAALTLYASIAIAILKYRLYDIEVVVRKTVVYSVLAVLLLIVALGGVWIVTVLFAGAAGSEAGLAVGIAIGVVFWPLRRVASRIADRVVFGGRVSPYEILTSFSGRVGEAYAADDVLPRMAHVLAEGVGAERATVWLRVGTELRPAATWPAGGALPTAHAVGADPISTGDGDHVVEIRDRDELVGALSVSMPASDPMNGSKERLVADLASQARLVLRSVRLIEELRASRQRLVTAQDHERRRLERNIHDGVQQQLVALAVQLKLLEGLVAREPAKASELAVRLQAAATEALDDLRDLARGIYPPLLADKGIVTAVEAQARRSIVPVTVEHEDVGRYAPELESTVYFCCLEALQNVAKYAHASTVVVRIAQRNGDLTFAITDDGVGFDPGAAAYGTGLQGMADRLDAVSGRLEVRSSPGAGTTVAGELPATGAAR